MPAVRSHGRHGSAAYDLPAGRETDALVAQHVFGYTLDYEFADLYFDGAPCVPELRDKNDEWGVLPCYSTEANDAWLVWERVRQMCEANAKGAEMWLQLDLAMCDLRDRDRPLYGWCAWFFLHADVPLTLCRVALALVEWKPEPACGAGGSDR